MGSEKKSFLIRYGTAILAVATGFLLRSLLSPLLGADVPFITLFPAVAVSALIGGFGAGLFAAFLSALFANLLIMPDSLSISLSQKDLTQTTVFLAMGVFISWVVGERERVQARLRKVETESEKALRESEERSLMAQKSTGVGIWEWNLKTDEVRWSEGIYNLLGLKRRQDKENYNKWLDFIFPEDRQAAKTKIQELIAEGQSEFYDEFRISRIDGAVRWIAVQGEITYGEDHQAARLRGVNYDITNRKEAELEIKHLNHELDRRNKELEAIFDIAPVGVAVALDADCNFISANPALAEMLGIKPGDNISVNPSNSDKVPYKHFRNGRELSAGELPMQRAVAEKRQILGEEIDILRPDGRVITIYGYAAPVFDEEGKVVSCIAAQIDVTERKKIERERERQFSLEQSLRKEAEQANRLKDEFLATVSHELRTPLNAILGWISILRHDDRISEKDKERATEAIERSAKSQAQLIEELLDVSRIISGKLQLNVKPVELTAVIDNAVETLRPAADAKGIEIHTKFDSQIGLVSGDPDRLQQIVWNLLSNAIKFTDKDGKVEIILGNDESQAELIISDTGRGIDAEFLPFIFDRFRQADGSTTRHYSGLGLGLSIVKHLVELHGGTVGAASEGEGKGSTFTVRLPLTGLPEFDKTEDKKANSADGNGLPTKYPKLHDLKILIVDDEPDTLEILSVVFENCRSKVKTASNASEALQIVKSWQPQIIVSDIGMPEEDGYSFLRKVRNWETEAKADGNFIQAVALTAYAHADDRSKALDAGFQMHIAKPVEPIELASLIECLVNEADG